MSRWGCQDVGAFHVGASRNLEKVISYIVWNYLIRGTISYQVIGLSLSSIALDFSANKFIGVFLIKVGNLKKIRIF